MIQSMTGFGRAAQRFAARSVLIEFRAVNHRYFECSCKVPSAYGFLEAPLKALAQSRLERGKVEALVSVQDAGAAAAQVRVQDAVAAGYVDAVRALQERYGLQGGLSAAQLAQMPQVLTLQQPPQDEAAVWADVQQVAKTALDALVDMRAAEGAHMCQDLCNHTARVLELVELVERRSPQTVQAYQEKLRVRLWELLEGAAVEESRVLAEAAVFADKVAVDEETVRLRSHLSQFDAILEQGGAVGRKLDFLVQEMNREANTIASKCADTQIAHWVVDMKAEIEKIREQVQNLA